MFTLDLSDEKNVRIAARLRTAPIAWLGSTRANGQPHLAPVWFFWDGETILVFTTVGSQKVRNLRDTPRATLALEGTTGGDVVIVEGQAELLAEPSAQVDAQGYFAKYESMMPAWGLTPQTLVARFDQPMRVRPTRVISW